MDALCKKHFFSIPRNIIRKICDECDVCNQAQPLKMKENYKHILAKKPWEKILIDLRTYKLQNNGYCWILTIIDVFTKYAFTFALKNKTGTEVKNHLQDLFYAVGSPQIIHSDNGKEFTNEHIKHLCETFKIKLIHGRLRHPQSQGQVERLNQTLTRYIQKQLTSKYDENKNMNENKKWVELYKKVTYEYNCAKHTATNKSPFELFYDRAGFNTVLFVNDYSEENIEFEYDDDFTNNDETNEKTQN